MHYFHRRHLTHIKNVAIAYKRILSYYTANNTRKKSVLIVRSYEQFVNKHTDVPFGPNTADARRGHGTTRPPLLSIHGDNVLLLFDVVVVVVVDDDDDDDAVVEVAFVR